MYVSPSLPQCHVILPVLFLLLFAGTESAVVMYLPEIEALVCSTLRETQSWLLKAQAAAAIATLAEKAGAECVAVCTVWGQVCGFGLVGVWAGGWVWYSRHVVCVCACIRMCICV